MVPWLYLPLAALTSQWFKSYSTHLTKLIFFMTDACDSSLCLFKTLEITLNKRYQVIIYKSYILFSQCNKKFWKLIQCLFFQLENIVFV